MARTLPNNKTDFALLKEIIACQDAKKKDGTHLYDWWQRWNNIYFENTLKPIIVSYQNTDYGRYLGYFRHSPIMEIVIQWRTKTVKRGSEVMQHDAFADLTTRQYCLALIVLHEMMHQACFEAGLDPGHEGQPWLDHCKFIGSDLKLGLTYSPMKRQKESVLKDGTVLRRAGRAVRQNVWRPTSTELFSGTDRFASHDEIIYFPFREDSAFIEANTSIVEKTSQLLVPRF